MMRLLPIAVFVGLAIALAMALQPSAPTNESTLRTLPALELTPLDRPIVLHKDLPVLMNFFASWCTPCIAEHDELMALQKQGVRIHGVVWNDTPEQARSWLQEHGSPYRSLWHDADGRAAMALGVRGVPESFLIGPDGKILFHLAGPIMPKDRKRITELLDAR